MSSSDAPSSAGGGGDVTPPSFGPGGTLTATRTGSSYAVVQWSAAQDDVGVVRYDVTVNGTRAGSVRGDVTSFRVGRLERATPYNLQVVAVDAAGNVSTDGPARAITTLDLLPEPRDIAPAVPRTRRVTFAEGISFLFQGPRALQQGVVPGAVHADLAAVVHGRVRAADGTGLPGVRVSVHGHPEWGSTLTREEGAYDLAVDGETPLTLDFQGTGVLPAQRKVLPLARDHAWVEDVTLLALDTAVTAFDVMGTEAVQAHQATPVMDGDGTRQATVLFRSGTAVQLRFADGSTMPLTTLHVRATEYTVGTRGPSAMPGELPPATAYTYAVELSVDEALMVGAASVEFDTPVPFYLDNFLGFPVGTSVPAGLYDRVRAAWVPSPDGRVVEITDVVAGEAQVNVGRGQTPEDIGMDVLERRKLAELFAPGTQLWRVAVPHFTPLDPNYPFSLPSDAASPGGTEGPGADPDADHADGPAETEPEKEANEEDRCKETGSIIRCQAQALGERVELPGTGETLHYESDEVPGRVAGRTLDIHVSGADLPPSVEAIHLEVSIAGQQHRFQLPAQPGLVRRFTWDGLDGYGRELVGAADYLVRVGYAYPVNFQEPPDLERSFGSPSGRPLPDAPGRQPFVLWTSWRGTLGAHDRRVAGLGGWDLESHHRYDPVTREVRRGDGARIRSGAVGATITRVAGNFEVFGEPSGPPLPALDHPFYVLEDVVVAPDGTLYIADRNHVWALGADNLVRAVAGGGSPADGVGDGLPATQARVRVGGHMTLGPDGSLYLTEVFGRRVRRVGPDGIITTVVGNGTMGYSGDGGPATAAQVSQVKDVAVAPDGTLYVSDVGNNVIRKVDPDGIITTIAGTTRAEFSGDGGPAREASLYGPSCLALAGDGTLYVCDAYNARIRAITPDGIIRTVAGTGVYGFTGDGGPATRAQVATWDLEILPDGSLLLGEYGDSGAVRRIDPSGRIRTVAGTGVIDWDNPPTGYARSAKLGYVVGLSVAADGSIFYADQSFNVIYAIRQPLPGHAADSVVVPSTDGREVFVFSDGGQHLRTLDASNGRALRVFGYDAEGWLSSVTTPRGVVQVVRTPDGTATAVAGPTGARTTLAMDADGYLESVVLPAGGTWRMEYAEGGLITRLQDPAGARWLFTHDGDGMLLRDEDPDGRFTELERSTVDGVPTVTLRDAAGLERQYALGDVPDGSVAVTHARPGGGVLRARRPTPDMQEVTRPNGTVSTTSIQPSTRFGGATAGNVQGSVVTPGGHVSSINVQRQVTLADPANPASVLLETTRVQRGTGTFEMILDRVAGTLTTRTPTGHITTRMLDAAGLTSDVITGTRAPIHVDRDAQGRPVAITQTVGGITRSTLYAYNAEGRLVTETDAEGGVLGRTYDADGRQATLVLQDGATIQHGRDAAGRPSSVTLPSGAVHRMEYSPGGRLVGLVLPEAVQGQPVRTQLAYDAAGRVSAITAPSGDVMRLEHGPSGILALEMPGDRRTYVHDAAAERVTAIPSTAGQSLAFTHDGPLVTRTQYSGVVNASVDFEYGDELLPSADSINGAHRVAYTRDDDGDVITAGPVTLGRGTGDGTVEAIGVGGVSESITASPFGETAARQVVREGTTLFSQVMEHDLVGRVTGITETVLGTSVSRAFAYDARGRLVSETREGVVTTYTHDANSNRLSRVVGTGTPETSTYDIQDRQLTRGDVSYAFNADGVLESVTLPQPSGVLTLQYDMLRNLRRAVLPDGREVTYVVDGRNRRVARRVDGALVQAFVHLDELRVAAELAPDGSVLSRFIYGSRINIPDAMVRGGRTYRIIPDHVGSPRLVVDVDTGQVAQRMEYDAFGRVLLDTQPGFQPFGFAGGLLDPDTGLVRFGARDYDPTTGRFTARDPAGFSAGDVNLYAYCKGDPVNCVDINGASPLHVAGAGALLGLVKGVAMALYCGDSMDEAITRVIGETLEGALAGALGALQQMAFGGLLGAALGGGVNKYLVGVLDGAIAGGMVEFMRSRLPEGETDSRQVLKDVRGSAEDGIIGGLVTGWANKVGGFWGDAFKELVGTMTAATFRAATDPDGVDPECACKSQ